MVKTTRRRRIPADKARKAALGGFYSRIEATQAGWPSCSSCGHNTALVDPEHYECLRCRMDRKRQAREALRREGCSDK